MRVLSGADDGTIYTLPSGPLLPDGSFTTSGDTREQVAQDIWDEQLAQMPVSESTPQTSSNLAAFLRKYSTAIYAAAGALFLMAVMNRPK
jgi:hypothetical protein